MLLVVSITNRCNFRCQMCDIGRRSSIGGLVNNLQGASEELTADDWRKVLKRYLKINRISLVGVEPLLHPQFEEIVSLFSDKAPLEITTNGFLLDRYFSSLLKNHVSLTVSLDSSLPNIHDKIRGVPGAFEKAWSSIGELRQSGLKVRCAYTILPENIEQMVSFRSMCKAIGVGTVYNHYNYISSNSCSLTKYGIPEVSNMEVYSPKNFNISLLGKNVELLGPNLFLPHLVTKELEVYYRTYPTSRALHSRKCVVLDELLSGKRLVVNANGDILIGNRCWIATRIGNVLQEEPLDLNLARQLQQDIRSGGLFPACRRLCCAGKAL